VSCVAVMNVCKAGVVLFFIMCMCCYLVFNFGNVSNIWLYMRHSCVVCFYRFYICGIFLRVDNIKMDLGEVGWDGMD
jgi:hypothetical protein